MSKKSKKKKRLWTYSVAPACTPLVEDGKVDNAPDGHDDGLIPLWPSDAWEGSNKIGDVNASVPPERGTLEIIRWFVGKQNKRK